MFFYGRLLCGLLGAGFPLPEMTGLMLAPPVGVELLPSARCRLPSLVTPLPGAPAASLRA